MEQLCWKCRKSTNSNLCPWVKYFAYPKGIELDCENNIVGCPLFEADTRREVRRVGTISRLFGISERTYYNYKYTYDLLYEKYKHCVSVPKVSTLCEYFNVDKSKVIQNYENFLKKYLTNQKMSV